MKNFLKEFGYLIYFYVSMIILTKHSPISFPLWFSMTAICYAVNRSTIAWKKHYEEYGNVEDNIDKYFLDKYCWAFFLGIIVSMFVPVICFKWWVIAIPTNCLAVYKTKYLKR